MPLHFAFPFRIVDDQLATVEQASTADVVGQAHALLLTEPGYFTRQPDLGLTDQAHRQGGPDVAEIQRQMDLYLDGEAIAEADTSQLDQLLGIVNVRVRP